MADYADGIKVSLIFFITPISAPISNKTFYYSEIERAITLWNKILKDCCINVQFNSITNAANADIVIHWTKVGRVFEGMCKYPSIINGEFRKISIDVGLKTNFLVKILLMKAYFLS